MSWGAVLFTHLYPPIFCCRCLEDVKRSWKSILCEEQAYFHVNRTAILLKIGFASTLLKLLVIFYLILFLYLQVVFHFIAQKLCSNYRLLFTISPKFKYYPFLYRWIVRCVGSASGFNDLYLSYAYTSSPCRPLRSIESKNSTTSTYVTGAWAVC